MIALALPVVDQPYYAEIARCIGEEAERRGYRIIVEQTLNDRVGQMIVFNVMVVAAAEVTVGHGLIVALMRRRPGATADDISVLRG